MAELSPLRFFLCTHKPITVFSGRVNGAPSDPFISIDWNNGATGTASSIGTSGAPVEGNTVFFGTSEGGRERGSVRLRSWTPSNGSGTSGTMIISENDDVAPIIENNDYITIKLFWQLWIRPPRLVQEGQQVLFFEDFDVTYTDQTDKWYPTAVAGPPAVVYLEGGSATASFVGDRSTAHAPGATLSSYLWTGHGSSEGTSSSQGTTGSPVTFTYSAAGQYLVSFQVTDSNGNSHTSYTWVFVIDPSAPTTNDAAYVDFDAISDNKDFGGGGGEMSFTVHGVASVAQFPRDTMVVHSKRGAQTTETATWPFRADVLDVGHIMSNTITQDPINNTTSFRVATITRLMNALKSYVATLTDNLAPSRWVEAKDITVDRMASFLFKWRSTLDTMTPIIFSGYGGLIQRQDFGPNTLMGQLQSLCNDAWIKVVANHQNVLYLEIDYNYQLLSERAAATTRKTLHKGIWTNAINITERQEYDLPTSKVKTGGILYGGNADLTDVTPLFSDAPGDLQKNYGREAGSSRFILESQADLNTRTGYMLAKENQRFPAVRMSFINDGSFTIVPQEVFPAIIEAADNNRGLAFTPDLIPRRIRRSYDHRNGLISYEVEFEISSTGPAGITVSLPTTPPREQYGPESPPPGDWEPVDVGLLTWKEEGSFQFYGLGGVTWENRDAGLSGSDLLDLFGQVDPWWWTFNKQSSYDPEKAIVFKLVADKVLRSVNAGRIDWNEITPTGTVSGTDFVGMDSDLFTNKSHFAVGRWTVTGTNASGIWFTDDDGATWSFASIT